jgi:hypothetical protein
MTRKRRIWISREKVEIVFEILREENTLAEFDKKIVFFMLLFSRMIMF